MLKLSVFFSMFLFVLVAGVTKSTYAQSQPVMYFCERYDSYDGEIGVSDRFTTGYLTVMVKCDRALDLEDCSIQFDRYNARLAKFEFYKKFPFVVERDMSYIFFAKTEDNDMKFEDPGFYRVFLLDESDRTVASAIIEIVK